MDQQSLRARRRERLVSEQANWSEVLLWAEEIGLEHMEYRHKTAERLANEAGTTLALLLAGIGGSLAYAVKIAEPDGAGAVAVGASAFCAYLVLVAVWLVWGCLLVRNLPAVRNEPGNLAQRGYPLDELREVELKNLQQRILETRTRNDTVARRLNTARILAALSPVVFVAVAGARFATVRAPDTPKTSPRCGVEASASAAPRGGLECDKKH